VVDLRAISIIFTIIIDCIPVFCPKIDPKRQIDKQVQQLVLQLNLLELDLNVFFILISKEGPEGI